MIALSPREREIALAGGLLNLVAAGSSRCTRPLRRSVRPLHEKLRDAIEAHLTVVSAALGISREAQQRTGASIKKIHNTLWPLGTATITVGGHQITADPQFPEDARQLLNYLNQGCD